LVLAVEIRVLTFGPLTASLPYNNEGELLAQSE
jgi:hypothetical protein